MSDARSESGQRGELLAEAYLRGRGMKPIARRFRTPAGEIDLVLADRDVLVFVEVKSQSSRDWLDPEQRVTRVKQLRLQRAAAAFLARRRWQERPCRFDVVTVILHPDGTHDIEHFPDAFGPRGW